MQPTKKVHRLGTNIGVRLSLGLAGTLEALLLARLLARLLAARPSNPSFALLYTVTNPLVGWLGWLDNGQPRFGASLEFSTLTLASCVPILAYLLWLWLRRSIS